MERKYCLLQLHVLEGGGYSHKFWIGVCHEGSYTLTLLKDEEYVITPKCKKNSGLRTFHSSTATHLWNGIEPSA